MTLEEYKSSIKRLQDQFELDKKLLAKEYALSNNSIKIGDIITDHVGSIKVEKIKFTFSSYGNPICVYQGVQLNKDGSIAKRQQHTDIYQSNIK